ncbi:MAG: T9SS type A sorting domain-containing protein [Saprospiraceae bacterium]
MKKCTAVNQPVYICTVFSPNLFSYANLDHTIRSSPHGNPIPCGGGQLLAQGTQLFTVVSNPGQLNLTTQQQALIQQVAADVGTFDYKIVAFSDPSNHMSETSLTFTVPSYETQVFTAEARYVDSHDDGGYTWAGQIQTLGKGDIMLTITPGSAPSGFIRFTDRYYSILGLSESLALLVKHDLSAYDLNSDDTFGEAPPPPPACINDTAFVDILILETPAARAKLDLLPPSYLTSAAATINFALFQSNVEKTYVRFQRHYNTFTPIGGCDGQVILNNSFVNNDPFLIDLRNTYKADGIILLTTCLDQAGWAVPGLNIQRPYAVVDLAHVMGPRFTLAHEFGHLFSAKHNREGNGGDEPNNDGTIKHGWRFFDSDDQEQWTIMAAYPDNARILHYSNPDIDYNDAPTGTPIDNNAFAARVGMCSMSQNEPVMPAFLRVLITGETTLCTATPEFPHTFKAFVTGPSPGIGMGPFNYEWRWSKYFITPSNPGAIIGSNSPELVLTYNLTCEGDRKYFLKVIVTNVIYNVVSQNTRLIDGRLCTDCPDFRDAQVSVVDNDPSLSIVPNPVNDLVTFKYTSSTDEPAILEIIRADGQVFQNTSIPPSKDGLGEQTFDLQNFPSGLYAVRIFQASSSVTRTFSIIK